MDEMLEVMQAILSELQEMNSKLDEIQGSGVYNSISDICDKLDNVDSSIASVELAIELNN